MGRMEFRQSMRGNVTLVTIGRVLRNLLNKKFVFFSIGEPLSTIEGIRHEPLPVACGGHDIACLRVVCRRMR